MWRVEVDNVVQFYIRTVNQQTWTNIFAAYNQQDNVWQFIYFRKTLYMLKTFFYVLLTVHLSIILVINQFSAQILVL